MPASHSLAAKRTSCAAGEVRSYPAGEYLPENLSDQPLELVFLELNAPAGREEGDPGSRSEEAGDEEGNEAQVTVG